MAVRAIVATDDKVNGKAKASDDILQSGLPNSIMLNFRPEAAHIGPDTAPLFFLQHACNWVRADILAEFE